MVEVVDGEYGVVGGELGEEGGVKQGAEEGHQGVVQF